MNNTNKIKRLNSLYPIGTKIAYRDDMDNEQQATIRTPFTELASGMVVVWFEEKAACYAADRVIGERGDK